MWSHLILMMRARRAVRSGRFEAALALLEDSLIREDRRAQELRREVLRGLLGRAERRLKTGHLTLAWKDVGRLQQLDPEFPGCAELVQELDELSRLTSERREQEEGLRRGFEAALDEGRLGDAREFLAGLEHRIDGPSFEELEKRLHERRMQASRALRDVRDYMRRGLEREAREAMNKARRLCTDSISFRERLVGLSAAWAKEQWREIQRSLGEGRTLDAARALTEWWQSDPESDDLAEAKDLLLCVADRLAEDARKLASEGRFQEALQLACQAPGLVAKVGVLRHLKEKLEHLDVLLASEEEDPRRRVQGLARLYAETKWAALADYLERLRGSCEELEVGLRSARDLLARGKPQDGKARLEAILVTWPGCDEARALLDGLIDDERERAEQLKAARQAVRDGRLLEAQRHLFRLVTGGCGAEEARSLLRDVERIRGKVAREVHALETRFDAGAAAEEVLAEIARLERMQQDSVELADLEARALRRKARQERETLVRAALGRRDVEGCIRAVREWVAEGEDRSLRSEERGKLQQIGGEIEAALRDELARGDPAFVCALGSGLRTWQDMLAIDLEPLLSEAGARVEEARTLAREGVELLEHKDVARADEALQRARSLSPREPEVLRLAHRLRRVSVEREELNKALELADVDRQGAKEKLAALGPTPRPLGSLVLQVKQKVERSGELESGCLLQVEEAGEFLLFTDDRLRVGNATGRSFPQLPVLARIKSHHATFVRAVSFHGGVSDAIEAAAGAEVRVNADPAGSKLKHGDRILLGGILPLVYLRPSPRSLSALLRIEKGFECRGTSRVLWLKQGGRDGRILIGRGREVHVRVPHAEPELYLYAPGRGRICVHFDGTGEVDGEPFTQDGELGAGATVTCGKIRFRLLPL